MKCPNCLRENESINRFCIYCGSSLSVPEAELSLKYEQIPVDDVPRQLKMLREEINQIKLFNNRLNERLTAVENLQGKVKSQIQLEQSYPEVASTQVPPRVEVWETAAPEQPPAPEQKARGVKLPGEWEQILGGNWLARIGVLALIIGIAFFLKLAFDRNWIGPPVRIILGVLSGIGLLAGGYFWRKKYPVLSQTISGGGIAILYISFFAAFAAFEMIPLYLAVILLFLVSSLSTVLAIKYNSMGLAIFGIIGAFIAPIILGFSSKGSGTAVTGQAIQLMVYIFIVDIGVLVLSTFRNWRWFTLLALVSSLVVFAGWYARFGHHISLFAVEISITIIFLIFIGATTLFHVLWRKPSYGFDYTLMIINAVAYLGISYGIMWSELRSWMGGFSFLLAIFYGGLTYLTYKRGKENINLSFFSLGIALVFLSIAIPVQLGDKAWTTTAWAVETLVLTWLAGFLNLPRLRYFSYAVSVAMIIRLVFFDTPIRIWDFKPVLNERFLAFAFGIAAMYLSAFLIWRDREKFNEWKTPFSTLIIIANVLTLWLLTFEVWDYFGRRIYDLTASHGISTTVNSLRNARNLSLTALLAVYAVVLLVIGILKRWRTVRIGGLALLVVPVVKVFVYDVFKLQNIYRIAAFVSLGTLLVISGYLYQRYSKDIKGFFTK